MEDEETEESELKIVKKSFPITVVKSVHEDEDEDEDEKTIKVIISSESIDRDRDSMSLIGLDTSAFLKNPIVLWNHNHNLPIGKAINLGMDEGNLVAEMRFAKKGVSEKADEIRALVEDGIINTASIGFIMEDIEFISKGDQYFWKIIKSELLEFSFVSVPSNKDAQILERAIKSFAEKKKGLKKPESSTNNNKAASKRARQMTILFLED